MFWDKISGVYDLFETVYNGKVYRRLGEKVAEEIMQNDIVLECARTVRGQCGDCAGTLVRQ